MPEHDGDDSRLYLVPPPCPQSRPSGADSLIDLYGLRDFANSVARQDPATNTKRKLRKSYKNHISDLPGKHPIPGPGESQWTLLDAALRPPVSSAEAEKSLDFSNDMISHLKFQKSSGGVPGFDAKLLAAPGLAQNNEGSDTARTPSGNVTVAPSPAAVSPGGSGSEDARKDKRKRKDLVNGEKRRRPNNYK